MNTDPTFAMILAGTRTLTAMLGGFAIAKGWMTSDQAAQTGGAVVVLITTGFALYSQYRNKQHVKIALTMTPAGGASPSASAATTPAPETAS